MRLLIARHAEDVGSGIPDLDRKLTEKGHEQAKELQKVVKSFEPSIIVTSQLTRAKETAEISSSGIPIIYNRLFNEQIGGESEDDTTDDGYVEKSQRLSGGESYGELYNRVKEGWQWLLNNYSNESKIVLICHGRYMSFLIPHILGLEPNGFNLAINNTSYLIFKIMEKWRPQLVLPMPCKFYL